MKFKLCKHELKAKTTFNNHHTPNTPALIAANFACIIGGDCGNPVANPPAAPINACLLRLKSSRKSPERLKLKNTKNNDKMNCRNIE